MKTLVVIFGLCFLVAVLQCLSPQTISSISAETSSIARGVYNNATANDAATSTSDNAPTATSDDGTPIRSQLIDACNQDDSLRSDLALLKTSGIIQEVAQVLVLRYGSSAEIVVQPTPNPLVWYHSDDADTALNFTCRYTVYFNNTPMPPFQSDLDFRVSSGVVQATGEHEVGLGTAFKVVQKDLNQ